MKNINNCFYAKKGGELNEEEIYVLSAGDCYGDYITDSVRGGKSTTTDTTAAAGGETAETTAGETAGDTKAESGDRKKVVFWYSHIQVMRQPVLRMRLRLITRARTSTS